MHAYVYNVVYMCKYYVVYAVTTANHNIWNTESGTSRTPNITKYRDIST